MKTAPLAPKPDSENKQDVVHMLFATSFIVLVACSFSTTSTADKIRIGAMCFFGIMFAIELCMALYERYQIKKEERKVNNKHNA